MLSPFAPFPRSKAPLDPQKYRSILEFLDKNNLETLEINRERVSTPRNLETSPADRDCELFVREIPRNIFEDELIPIFQYFGVVRKFRLKLDFFGFNLGYAHVSYATPGEAHRATSMLDNYEIRANRRLRVYPSVDNCRLVIDGVPLDKTDQEICDALKGRADGIAKIILNPALVSGDSDSCSGYIEFVHRKAAGLGLRRLGSQFVLWDKEVHVRWIHPLPEVPEEMMSRVNNLYIRNIPILYNVRASLRGIVDLSTITKIHWFKNSTCIHFTCNQSAEIAMNALKETGILGDGVEILWASPPRFQRMDAPERESNALDPMFDRELQMAFLRRLLPRLLARGRLTVRDGAFRPTGR